MSIDTTYALDGYVQDMLTNTDMTPRERATHAAAAIHVHALTEAMLPLNTPLPVEGEAAVIYTGAMASHTGFDVDAEMRFISVGHEDDCDWIDLEQRVSEASKSNIIDLGGRVLATVQEDEDA